MKIKISTSLICFLCIGLFNVNAQKEAPKVQKKVVIVKKTVDEDGNETVEKIVKEGADANKYIEEIHIDENGNKEIKVRVKTTGDGENIWISDDNQVIDLKGKKYEFHSDENSMDDNIHKKIKIVTKGEKGEDEVIEWDGDGEMPAELIKQLKEKGIDIKNLDGGKGMFIMKSDGEDLHFNHEFDIDIDIDDMEDLTPEMKEKLHRIHKEKGEHHDHDFVINTSKINTNKAFLGVNIENIDGGVKVVSVIEESAAAEAGIQAGDIIKTISGKKAGNVDELIDALTPFNVGDEVAVELDRNGVATKVMAVLKERSDLQFHEEGEDHENIEIIVIKDCDTNFSGDEDIDIIFQTIGEEDGMKEITKEIIIVKEGEGGEEVHKEVEVTVEIVTEEENIVKEAPIVNEEKSEVVNSERIKNMARLKLKDFKAFPNPTDGVLNISFSGKKGPMIIQMTDISGKRVYKNNLQSFDGQYNGEISFDGLPKGNYVLYIIQNGRIFTDNIIFN